MKILITGANGLLGKYITRQLLLEGHQVSALARSPERVLELPPEKVFRWKHTEVPSRESLEGIDAVINLAGENIAGSRWTESRKKSINESRWLGTQNLLEGISKLPADQRPKLFLSTSATGIYGDTQQNEVHEDSPKGQDFLADVCRRWEGAAERAQDLGMRVVLMRLGVILSKEGGALSKMGPAILGDGEQWMSWVHIQDVSNFIRAALANENLSGPFNLVAPQSVKNRDFTKTLARVLKFPITLPTPSAVLKLVLGEMSGMLLSNQRVVPKKLLAAGFQFEFHDLELTLRDLFNNNSFLDNYHIVNQFVPLSRKQVFPFFSKAENLGIITPPWLQFRITRKSSEQVEKNTTIEYTLKIRGIPVRWKTLITEWNPDASFVDDQLRGPYSKWHHLHLFEEVPGGTLLRDEVTFQVPGWYLGRLFLVPFIRREVNAIFSYRQKKIAELLERGALE